MSTPLRTAVFVSLSGEERDHLKELARRDGVTLCQWIRDCVNDRLVELGDDTRLLSWRRIQRVQR